MSAPPANPRLSVVVSTYGRSAILAKTLDCLAQQDLPAGQYEIIVSDDGSPDDTRAVVERFQRQAASEVKYAWHPNRGPGYTHNCGVKLAEAPVVLFLADDVYLERQALAAHVRAHELLGDSRCAVLGRVSQSPLAQTTVFMRHWDPHHFMHALPDGAELPHTLFWANQISLQREFLLASGLFREEMGVAGPAAHEDVELGCRLAKRGLRILYCRAAHGYHYHPETLETAAQRARERGANFEEFSRLASENDLAIRYQILNWKTLLAQLSAPFRRNRASTLASDRSYAMLVRNLVRQAVFNRLTVPRLWRPIADQAEISPRLGALMNGAIYRGIVQFYFLEGIRASSSRATAAPVDRPACARPWEVATDGAAFRGPPGSSSLDPTICAFPAAGASHDAN